MRITYHACTFSVRRRKGSKDAVSTRAHTLEVESERQRVEKVGALVKIDMPYIVLKSGHKLSITRTVADYMFKTVPGKAKDEQPVLGSPPNTHNFEISQLRFVINATDGLWAVIAAKDAMEHVQGFLDRSGGQVRGAAADLLKRARTEWGKKAKKTKDFDDIAIVISLFKE